MPRATQKKYYSAPGCTNLSNPFSPLEVCTYDNDVQEQLFYIYFFSSIVKYIFYSMALVQNSNCILEL